MRRSLLILLLLMLSGSVFAQSTTPEPGDPPTAALINISMPDTDGNVTITGGAGAVVPLIQVAIRNLYTQQIVYTSAGISGSFSAVLPGQGGTPFWISPAQNIPNNLRNQPVTLPGGPGVILYAPAQENLNVSSIPVTQIIVDGSLEDWSAYPTASLDDETYVLLNQNSLYIGLNRALPVGAQVALNLTLNGITYEVVFDPGLPQTAVLREIAPSTRDLGTLAVAASVTENALEARFALSDIQANPDLNTVILTEISLRAGAETLEVQPFDAALIPLNEQDGIVYAGGMLTGNPNRFSVAGVLAQGASTWSAAGRATTLTPSPGETLTIEMDVTLNVPDLATSLVGLDLIGEISLQPVTVGEGGTQNIAALHTNNGWSNVLTPSGLAVDNLRGDVMLSSVTVPAAQVVRKGNILLAGFQFNLTLPDDLPAGIYVPTFQGKAQIGDGEIFNWEDNGIFGTGTGTARMPLTRLPLVLNVGAVGESQLLWTLFEDYPSDGSRGILPDESSTLAALSNRIKFNSPTYILLPGNYPIEPYLLNQMPNSYDVVAAPLLPLLLPGGRLDAVITLPDGTTNDLPSAPVVQNRISTDALDERVLYGGQSPQDVYQVTTSNPSYSQFSFDQYGEYLISLTGVLEDIYGNRFAGGGTYHLVIAQPLDLIPGVLPGTPFEVGDAFFAGGRVAPGMPADVTIGITVYPLDGSETIHQSFEIQADRYGFFAASDTAFVFDTPGEYIIDYDARFTAADGRLWAASLRSAGIIASPQSELIAHGKRGIDDYSGMEGDSYRPAWFTTAQYPVDINAPARSMLNIPYHTGDVATVQDNIINGIRPALTAQDVSGAYRDWLLGTLQNFTSVDGLSIQQLATLAELPVMPVLAGTQPETGAPLRPDFVINQAYSYISAVRPDVSIRQMVLGADDHALPLQWDGSDPYNMQIGAGITGDRPGDYAFIFGGTIVRNIEANVQIAAPYASLVVMTENDIPPAVYPPYKNALLTVLDEAVDMFFHPTGVRPGQVLTVGSPLVIAGQVAPTLPSQVNTLVTAPDGTHYNLSGETNAVGYFYDPSNTLTLDIPGVWQVQISTQPLGISSAGQLEPPFPSGGVLGAVNRTFNVIVVPEDAVPLEWLQGESVADTSFRAGVPTNFGLNIPEGWTDPQISYTISTLSYVLESGTLTRSGNTLSYQLSPSRLGGNFPNLETDGSGTGAASSDVIFLTFAITGTDADGNPAVRARTFTLLHDRLVSFDGIANE